MIKNTVFSFDCSTLEDEGNMIFRNTVNHLPSDTV